MPPQATQAATLSAQPHLVAKAPEMREAMPSSYTPIPNALLDEVMPTLLGSEWQLLCVVIRQTQGWHDPNTGRRKESDWLSHRQLKARTGRGSDAVCNAIESLVRQGFIEVKDEQGHLLPTAQERRRNGSRLFYGLGPLWRAHFEPQPVADGGAASVPFRRSRIGKAETTKETETKSLSEAFGKTESLRHRTTTSRTKPARDGEGCACLQIAPSTPQAPDIKPISNTLTAPQLSDDARSVITAYTSAARARDASLSSFPASLSADDAQRLEAAVARYGLNRLLTLLAAFFDHDSKLIIRHGPSLAAFLNSIHILASLRPHRRERHG